MSAAPVTTVPMEPAETIDLAATFAEPTFADRLRQRAANHDAANTFPFDDLADLTQLGWTVAPLPIDLGGQALDLAEMARAQRQLAQAAPATALSLGMHLYWVGMATDLARAGDRRLDWLLDAVAGGALLASGHAERGNDVPVALSTTRAERVDGGWRLYGRKLFGSLGPAWDLLGFHAMDASSPAGPVVVHGFVRRDEAGVAVAETWDAHGMRPTQSHDTVLEGAFVPDEHVLCVVPAGDLSHPALGAMLLWALTLLANVYLGVAERSMTLALEAARGKSSIALPGSTLGTNPFIQHHLADMHLELDAARATLDRLAHDWVSGVDHGPAWAVQILSAKWRATTAAERVVALAGEVVGGASFARGSELERLTRDVRAGRLHPGTDAYTHEAIGKALAGADPAGPRF